MIVGRNPRNPVIGDTVLLRAGNRRGVGTIVDTNPIRYKVYWRNGRGMLSWHARGELTVPRLDYDSDGRDSPVAATVGGGDGCRTREGRK
jgi:hypothetical protein